MDVVAYAVVKSVSPYTYLRDIFDNFRLKVQVFVLMIIFCLDQDIAI